MDAERTPVIVGVGQVNDRPATPEKGLDPIGLMAEALWRADADADAGADRGRRGWLADCDSLAVVRQIAWPHLDPVDGALAEALGIDPAHREQTAMPHGDGPVRLLNDAANRIGAGEARVCAVVGGEALRTASQLAAAKRSKDGEKPDAIRDASHRVRTGYVQDHGLVLPIDVYPLYENAIRHRLGQSLAEGQGESAAMWSRMSSVAAENPHAWLRQTVTPEVVITPSARNRPIAFPYTKLQIANSAVNQGAGFIVTSLAEARRRGMKESRLVFVGNGAAAHEDDQIMARPCYDHSAGLEVSITRTLALNGLCTEGLDHVELYSCFPCVPKLARRVLGWPLEKPITVFGGLTFGGGPIGNYMSHAIASMVDLLRRGRATGLLHGNGGYGTHNHSILLASHPIEAARFPRSYDFQAEADARRDPAPPLDETYAGPATVETWTVHYDRAGKPRLATIIARTPAGARTLAIIESGDPNRFAELTKVDQSIIGRAGQIVRPGHGIGSWCFPPAGAENRRFNP